MSRYRKYSDNYLEILKGLRLTEKSPGNGRPPFDLSPMSQEEYISIIRADKCRTMAIALHATEQNNAAQILDKIFDQQYYTYNHCYLQGEYDARNTVFTTQCNPKLYDLLTTSVSEEDTQYTANLGFIYIDDNNIPCGFSISRFGHAPNAQFFFTHIRNILAPYEERQVTFIASDAMMKDAYYANMHHTHHEEIIDESRIMRELRSQIGSPKIAEFIASVFDVNNHITEETLTNFKQRLGAYNLDNRDLVMKQIPKIIDTVKQYNPSAAAHIADLFKKDDINFFRNDQYEALLHDLITNSQASPKATPQIRTTLLNIYLEYLIIQLYNQENAEIEKWLKTGISEPEVRSLHAHFKQFHEPTLGKEFVDQCNQLYRNTHYAALLVGLQHAIADCSIPALQQNARLELKWLSQLTEEGFSKLKLSQQNTIFKFMNELAKFTVSPDDNHYNELQKLYPKVRSETSRLETAWLQVESTRFKNNIALFKQYLAQSSHPYVRKELTRHISLLKRIGTSFSKQPLEKQREINKFMQHLNAFAFKPSEEFLNQIESYYEQFNFTKLGETERQQLLLPINNAQVRHAIEEELYIFDTQGQMLVTTGNNVPDDPPIMWSIHAQDIYLEIDQHFKQRLSGFLIQKQISPDLATKLLDLYEKQKTHLFPLQQALYLYLDELAQTYQNHMFSPTMSDNTRKKAVSNVAKILNTDVLTTLAHGLVRAGIHNNGEVRKALDADMLYKILVEAQVSLRKKGKKLLVEQLQQVFHKQTEVEAISKQTLHSKLMKLDTSQSLATQITTRTPEPGYNCRKIKTLKLNQSNLIIEEALPRTIIHTDALNVPDTIPEAEYHAQFQHRLTTIANAFSFIDHESITYYLYDANPLQIQQSIAAIHDFNRSMLTQPDAKISHCGLQICHFPDSGIQLGYPLFELGGTTSELTLMLEMTLCRQISLCDKNQAVDLSGYERFLNPPPSLFGTLFRSNLFASSSEGREIRTNIEQKKEEWQHAPNSSPPKNITSVVTQALQKLMAFDLHYEASYSILIQACSLHINKKTILQQEETAKIIALPLLEHAQIFDLNKLPASIETPLYALMGATDKKTATKSAHLLSSAMKDYCIKHQNMSTLSSVYQESIHFAQESAASEQDIAQTITYITTPPASRQIQVNPSSVGISKSRHTLFGGKNRQESSSALETASKNKAKAFKPRGSSDSEAE